MINGPERRRLLISLGWRGFGVMSSLTGFHRGGRLRGGSGGNPRGKCFTVQRDFVTCSSVSRKARVAGQRNEVHQ